MTDETPPDSLIPYDEYVQDALRGVVYLTLSNIASEGSLPGDHHFYIAFKTRAEGVNIPAQLMEKYPDEMTIVVQHRYWDLKVDHEGFEIGLSFNQVPSKLVVPLSAVTGFVDPSVNFALQFPPPDVTAAKPALKSVDGDDAARTKSAEHAPSTPATDVDTAPPAAGAKDEKTAAAKDEKPKDNVVSIDFRKK
ncbi:hypothetical protein KCG44_03280 [Pacificimonas sp. WHA3]|uniref:Stringent starvation protein B n=1 Tax=Pacificimonas pallii TaxID=2827236 RepID=A0ABS6SBR8_9SPHN|nr:ClpXP protease specificity-enhancing factor SspB [Pacificimonas pallii]MBV7255805.1 hypothetical protein [Pacificimonas pallii]